MGSAVNSYPWSVFSNIARTYVHQFVDWGLREQNGHFLTRPAGKNISISNILVVKDGCQSDHLSILLEAKTKSRRAPRKKVRPDKKRSTAPKLKIKFDILKKNKSKRQRFHHKISEAQANSIVAATKEIATELDTPKPDWFEGFKHELIKVIYVCNAAYINFTQRDSQQNQVRRKEACCHLKRANRRSKREWQRDIAKGCSTEEFTDNPRHAWNVCRKKCRMIQRTLEKGCSPTILQR
jgi:hypothetical protein